MSKPKSNNADGVGKGAHDAGKDDSATSTLRKDSLPRPEEVRELPLLNPDKKAVECAEKQNRMSPDGQFAQVPSGRDHKSTTGSGN
jgi:hypothetical protein